MGKSLKEISTEQKQKILLFFTVLGVFVPILILNYLFPIFADDWSYSFIFGSDVKISSLYDIIISQYNHYMTWGGRSVVHFIAQALLMSDFWITCIFNALAYTGFIYILYKIANYGNKIKPSIFFLFNVLIWLCQPAFYATTLWKTGSANYLWGTLITISFTYQYYSYYCSRKASNNVVKSFLFLILGIIAGWTNENMGVALIFYILISFFILKYEKSIIPNWAITGLIGVIIGCIIMLLAPGNYVRLEMINEIYAKQGMSRSDIFLIVIKDASRYFFKYIIPLLVSYFILLFIYKKNNIEKSKKQIIIRSSVLFLVTAIVAFTALLASPSMPDRALFGVIVLFIIANGIICANIDFSPKYLKTFSIIAFCTLCIIYGIQYGKAYKALNYTSSLWNERANYINEQKKEGINTIEFSKQFKISGRYFIHDLSDDPTNWENQAYAKYYEIKSVKVITNE